MDINPTDRCVDEWINPTNRCVWTNGLTLQTDECGRMDECLNQEHKVAKPKITLCDSFYQITLCVRQFLAALYV